MSRAWIARLMRTARRVGARARTRSEIMPAACALRGGRFMPTLGWAVRWMPFAVIAVAMGVLPRVVVAQRSSELVVGAELRVHLTGTPPVVIRGDLLALDSTVLALARFRGDSLRIPYDEIARVDLRRERSLTAAFGRGAVRGLVVGLVTSGVLLGAGVYADQRNPCGDCFITATGAAAIASVAVTSVATGVGGLIGLTRRGHWVTVARGTPEPPGSR